MISLVLIKIFHLSDPVHRAEDLFTLNVDLDAAEFACQSLQLLFEFAEADLKVFNVYEHDHGKNVALHDGLCDIKYICSFLNFRHICF